MDVAGIGQCLNVSTAVKMTGTEVGREKDVSVWNLSKGKDKAFQDKKTVETAAKNEEPQILRSSPLEPLKNEDKKLPQNHDSALESSTGALGLRTPAQGSYFHRCHTCPPHAVCDPQIANDI
ncbi:hypothetical protein WISP_112744 [Willisornis vidua]|uniref:Uncharacterized protein n=1 Tax=Willisornis vidua TaxID=1566151 RepID=A0ABQ9CV29_9PASS|nr:hypothetical protein WISP_112744 [Willisornis vidua]